MITTIDSSQVPLMVGQKWKDKRGTVVELIDYNPDTKKFCGARPGAWRCYYDSQGIELASESGNGNLVDLMDAGPLFEPGQVWLRANGAKVTLLREQGVLRAYFVDEEDPENKLLATVEWCKRDPYLNLVKLLQTNKCCLMVPSPKPPLGLRPRFIALEERINEINEAIDRYKQAGMAISVEWMNEKNTILEELNCLSFDHWWNSEGSTMVPKTDEDREAHVHRISRIAWSNGFFRGRYHKTT